MKNLQQDKHFMQQAIEVSSQALGFTGSNPPVGAVLVQKREGDIFITQAHTGVGGRPHAEAVVIAQAKKRGVSVKGATLYVTLEPCAHYGVTPPCAELLIKEKIARVVIACQDPDQRVSGRGIALLQQAGTEVCLGVERAAAKKVLRYYFLQRLLGRPFVTVKLAVSGDGGIGLKGKGQTAISGRESFVYRHLLRAQNDAILIGANTALEDDPLLTCRLENVYKPKLLRVVIDKNLRLPLTSALVHSAVSHPLYIVCAADTALEKQKLLQEKSVKILYGSYNNHLLELGNLLQKLAKLGIISLLVEGGADTITHFLAAGLVDRLCVLENPSCSLGENAIKAPDLLPFIQVATLEEELKFGQEKCHIWVKEQPCLQGL